MSNCGMGIGSRQITMYKLTRINRHNQDRNSYEIRLGVYIPLHLMLIVQTLYHFIILCNLSY